MKREGIVIYGAGGFAREVAWLVESCNSNGNRYEINCFVDDRPAMQGKILNDIPIMSLEDAYRRFPDSLVVAAVGTPQDKALVVKKAIEQGFLFETIIHPKTEMSKWVEVSNGTIICAGCILTTNIRIGRHVHINLDCTIGHDVAIEDYSTLAPGVHISGRVHIGKNVYIGTGAVVINGTEQQHLVIGDEVIIGAGACVTRDLPSHRTFVGVPAKYIR